MDPRAQLPVMTVSNLVPVWDEPDVAVAEVAVAVVPATHAVVDGGGSFAPAEAATVVAQALRVDQPETRLVTPPERYDPTDFVERESAFSYDLLDDRDHTWAERSGHEPARLDQPGTEADVAAVQASTAHERRSAYEISFILLTAAVAVLLAAPPLVQILLAARGIQA